MIAELTSIAAVLVIAVYLPIRQYRRGEEMGTLAVLSVIGFCVGCVALLVGAIAPDLAMIGIGAAITTVSVGAWFLFRAFPQGNAGRGQHTKSQDLHNESVED